MIARGLALLVGLVAAATLLSCFGRFAWPLDLLSFARQHLFLASILLSVAAIVARCRRWAIVAAAAAAANGLMLLPTIGGGMAPAVAAMPSQALRVVTLNVLVDNHHSRHVVSFLRASGADVIAIQEVSSWWADKLTLLSDIYPYVAPVQGAGDSAIVVLSRFPIVAMERLRPPPDSVVGDLDWPVRVLIAVGDLEVAVYAVHPPTPRSLQQWAARNNQIEWLGPVSRQLDADRPRVMLGDFNTPPWSYLFTDLTAAARLHDAGGAFRQPTRQPMLAAPYLAWLGAPVDHVLVSPEIGVASFAVGPSVFSDHLPVVADLRPHQAQSADVSPAR